MEAIQDIPSSSIPVDVWRAGFMLLGCVVVYLFSHLISWFKSTMKTYGEDIKKLTVETAVTRERIDNMEERLERAEAIATVKYKNNK